MALALLLALGGIVALGMGLLSDGDDHAAEDLADQIAPTAPPVIVSPTEPPAESAALPTDPAGTTVVCLDPGHGGDDPGFAWLAPDGVTLLHEADFVLAQAWDLASRLRERGFTVVMTREIPDRVNPGDLDVNGDGERAIDSERAGTLDELQARIDVCNAADADLLVSMHLNGTEANLGARGFEVWYTGCRGFGDESSRFATLAYRSFAEELGTVGDIPGREANDDCVVGAREEEDGLLPNMVLTGPDVAGVVVASRMPGAIVEPLFLSNTEDAAFLVSDAGHDAIVSAYEAAIAAYFDGDAA